MLINTCFSIDGTRLSVYSQTFLFSSIEEQGSPNLTYLALIRYYRHNGYAAMKKKLDEDRKNFLVGSAW